MCQKLNPSSSVITPNKSLTVLTTFLKKLIKVCSFSTLGQKKEALQNSQDLPSRLSPIQFTKTNWSELPEDIIEEILNKIDMCEDYLSFSTVCRLWHSISQGINSRSPFKIPRYHFLPMKSSIPMLLQPGGEEGGDMHYLYSTTEEKIYSGLHIPEINNKRILGSADGWLVTIDVSDLKMNLLNPLTGVLISLPDSSTFQKPNPPLFHDGSNFNFVKRVHISSNPVDDAGNCLCVAMVSYKRTLSVCKIGDYKWKKIDPSIVGINDVITYKGLLYATNWEGKLFAIEVGPKTKVTIVTKLEVSRGRPQYLIKSSRDLLLVVRMRQSIGPTVQLETGVENIPTIPLRCHIKTIGFTVYKLVETQSTNNDTHEQFRTEDDVIHYQDEPIRFAWEEIDTLDGMTLFVGHNQCSYLDPDLYPGSRKNCIYFADCNLEHDSAKFRKLFRPHDIGFYDMKSREIEELPGLSESSSRISPIWISPNLY